jgi:hypothetical protein
VVCRAAVGPRWGVEVFRGDGQEAPDGAIPASYHRALGGVLAPDQVVRDLPVDTGVRALPVVHFYSVGGWSDEIPVAFEVGFRHGRAAAWYPQVNRLVPPERANRVVDRAQYMDLQARPGVRLPPIGLGASPGDVPSPISRPQLVWAGLTLTQEPRSAPVVAADTPWVESLRTVESMWVNHAAETERFLFYEGKTRGAPAVVVERAEEWSPQRPHYRVRNVSPWPVHDIMVVHNDEDGASMFLAPTVPAGATAGFLLEAHAAIDGSGDVAA